MGFFIATTYVVLAIWWYVWALNDKASWNFLEFLILMGSPISLYLAAQLLVSDAPSDVANWRHHFENVHKWFFGSLLSTALFALLRTTVVLGDNSPFAIALVGLAVVLSLGIFLNHRRLHSAILAVWFLFQIFGMTQSYTAS